MEKKYIVMEVVLETYAQPYDESHPVLCMDEQPVQLLKENWLFIQCRKVIFFEVWSSVRYEK